MAAVNNVPTIGEVLALEFLEPMNISQNALAKALGIPQNRLSDIINGKRGVSADTDLRLCKYFGLTDGYFTGMQMDFERIAARQKLQNELKKIIPYKKCFGIRNSRLSSRSLPAARRPPFHQAQKPLF